MQEQERYLDTADHTVVIEPMRRQHWIYDGADWKHEGSVQRAIRFERRALQWAQDWEKGDERMPLVYLPTTRELDSLNKWTNPPADRHCPGFQHAFLSADRLPAISKLLYDNVLPNKSFGDIEHEVRETERRQAHRLFDTSGSIR